MDDDEAEGESPSVAPSATVAAERIACTDSDVERCRLRRRAADVERAFATPLLLLLLLLLLPPLLPPVTPATLVTLPALLVVTAMLPPECEEDDGVKCW